MGLLRRNIAMALGWYVIKVLARTGLPYARKKLQKQNGKTAKQNRRRNRR